jgi:hypothetical protein
MISVNDFYQHEKMSLACSTDGRLPAGTWEAYKVFRGKLTHIPRHELSQHELTKNHVLIYGTYGEHPQTEEDISTLRVNGLVRFVCEPGDHLFQKAHAKQSEKQSVPQDETPIEEKIDVKADAIRLSETAAQYQITTSEEYERGAQIVKELKAMQHEVSKTFDPIVEKAYLAHREATAQRAKYLDPLKDGEKRVKAAMADWTRKEQARIIAERKAAEDAAALERAALEAAKKQSYEDAVKSGDLQAAREIASINPVEEIKVVEPVQAKVAGVSTRKTYRAEVTDLAALVKAAVDIPQYLSFLSANEQALNALARAAKTTSCAIPGVRFIEDVVVGVRA